MIYEEFSNYKEVLDRNNPFCNHYVLESGEDFYVEPVFYTMLKGFKERRSDDYQRIIDKMIEVVKRNKKVVFVGNFEYPQTEVGEEYIFLEITDITDPLQIFVEDKSRGSDYGD